MKIIQLTPGSGDNFYCENCLRDAVLVRAWRQQGHDAMVMPLYLPVNMEYVQQCVLPEIFMGGINVYLQQKWNLFRKTPRWLDKLFDSKSLLTLAAGQAGSTEAKELGETTLSMLRGEEGRQAKEIDRLVKWLAARERPDAIILSNALLIGLARRIKKTLQVPIFCLLQDEDEFLDIMPEPFKSQSWKLIRDRSGDIDLFLSVSAFYTAFMKERLELTDDHIRTTPLGIMPGDFIPIPEEPQRPTIGYLSRMCPQKGLDILVQSFIELKKDERFQTVKLRIAGGKSPADKLFIEAQRQAMLKAGIPEDDFEFLNNFKHDHRQAFLHSLTVLAVPEKRPPAFGLYALEALACGTPVAVPEHGVFPEMKLLLGEAITLVQPDNSAALRNALEPLLLDGKTSHRNGLEGCRQINQHYNILTNSQQVLETMQQYIGQA